MHFAKLSCVYISDLNDAEPRLSDFHFRKKNEPEPNRDFYKTLQSRNDAFLKLHFNTNFYTFHIYINLKKIICANFAIH